MKGTLTSDHTACLSPVILEAGGDHEVVVDMGFTGFLYLPEDTISSWGLHFVSNIPMLLADQSTVIADVYEATVVWFGSPLRVPVLEGPSGSVSLIGMGFLEGCCIELDRAKSEVRLEQL